MWMLTLQSYWNETMQCYLALWDTVPNSCKRDGSYWGRWYITPQISTLALGQAPSAQSGPISTLALGQAPKLMISMLFPKLIAWVLLCICNPIHLLNHLLTPVQKSIVNVVVVITDTRKWDWCQTIGVECIHAQDILCWDCITRARGMVSKGQKLQLYLCALFFISRNILRSFGSSSWESNQQKGWWHLFLGSVFAAVHCCKKV